MSPPLPSEQPDRDRPRYDPDLPSSHSGNPEGTPPTAVGPDGGALLSLPNRVTDVVQVSGEVMDEPTETPAANLRRLFWRKIRLPALLFLLTCGSTFIAGAARWMPDVAIMHSATSELISPMNSLYWRRSAYTNFYEALTYMGCVLAILLAHEMGHYVATLIHRVRATLPYFIPFPVSPMGTMGAVIGMEAHKADRRQMFDIGLAGPLAGLLVALPILAIGISQLDFSQPVDGTRVFDLPLAVRYWINWAHPNQLKDGGVAVTQVNGFFMAAWVGLLVTGLNMMPVSQLDGGHVTYALFGRFAHWLARGFMVFVFAYFAYTQDFNLLLMAILVLALGTDHPPTSDDRRPLGPVRFALGLLSLSIPLLTFAPGLFR